MDSISPQSPFYLHGLTSGSTKIYPDFSSGPLTFFHGNMAAFRRELQVKFEMEASLPPSLAGPNLVRCARNVKPAARIKVADMRKGKDSRSLCRGGLGLEGRNCHITLGAKVR